MYLSKAYFFFIDILILPSLILFVSNLQMLLFAGYYHFYQKLLKFLILKTYHYPAFSLYTFH